MGKDKDDGCGVDEVADAPEVAPDGDGGSQEIPVDAAFSDYRFQPIAWETIQPMLELRDRRRQRTG